VTTKQEEEDVRERSPSRSLSPRAVKCKKRDSAHGKRRRMGAKKRQRYSTRARRSGSGRKKKVSWKDPLVEYRIFDSTE